MNRYLPWNLLILVLLAGCSTHPKLLSYLELPPPEKVASRFVGDSLVVRWTPITLPQKRQGKPFWYRVYLSRTSLMFVPVKKLPAPAAEVPGDCTRAVLRNLPGGKEWFLHVRSSSANGDLSLPSLPEVHLVREKQG